MTGKLYETAMDLQHEKRIAQAIIDATNWKLHKLPIKYRADYIATDRNDIGHSIIEIKKRGICKNQYEHVFISLDKHEYCSGLSDKYQLDFYYFVEFMDGLHFSKNPVPDRIKMTGRRDRDDKDDIEPIALLPNVDFSPINQLLDF